MCTATLTWIYIIYRCKNFVPRKLSHAFTCNAVKFKFSFFNLSDEEIVTIVIMLDAYCHITYMPLYTNITITVADPFDYFFFQFLWISSTHFIHLDFPFKEKKCRHGGDTISGCYILHVWKQNKEKNKIQWCRERGHKIQSSKEGCYLRSHGKPSN